ncbi:flagellar motor protein MotB [Paenibacillus sp. FSL A5-0031]|uniref:flagellar motor protein MotB n=1 Tax=Paenibacillus sp. FSL A5-0031 TaxID=1920420 RepID=UPI00096E5E4C|nr:flagellar motor protein MotB [Paenibacillus sp. FSL A5-0031]OME78701.1 flagellar motor protein MotB [Paenibacillus sp. FSL A5-0031]
MKRKHNNHNEHEEHVDESWLIPYADLLTLLLALFIVLYSMNTVDEKKFEEMSRAFNITFNSGTGELDQNSIVLNKFENNEINAGKRRKSEQQVQEQQVQQVQQVQEQQLQGLMEIEQEELEEIKNQIDQFIKIENLQSQLETKLNQSELMITISNTALFEPGKDRIIPEVKKLANTISSVLQQYPEYEIMVSGHTDNIPISTSEFRSNWDLSSKRALRFMDIILLNKKLNPKKFSTAGYGEYRPIASNSTMDGRSKNRRVEVSIIRKYINHNFDSIKINP